MTTLQQSVVSGLCILVLVALAACTEQQPADKQTNQVVETNVQAASQQAGAQSVDSQWIAGWYPTASMTGKRAGAAAVVANNTIYMIGGIDGRNFLQTTEYTVIQKDGSLNEWQQGPPLNEARGFIDAVERNGYLYVTGGGNGPNGKNLLRTTERAKIQVDGSLGAWETEPGLMVTPRRCSKMLVVGDYLYALGGFAGTLLDTVERARILDDGHLGEWVLEEQHLTIPRYINTVKSFNDVMYVIGGHDQTKGAGITDVEWARPNAVGTVANWLTAASLQTGRYGLTSARHKNRLYALGGLTGLEYLDSVETMELGENGEPGAWRFTTPLSVPRATFSTVSFQGKIYVLGGTNEDNYLSSVEFATINDQGDPGFWGTEKDAKGYAAFKVQLKQQRPALPNEGTVQHVQQASMYTYLSVKSNLGDIWLAGPKIGLQVGDKIQFSKGVSMSNFYSKELQQQFPVILFVSKIRQSDK